MTRQQEAMIRYLKSKHNGNFALGASVYPDNPRELTAAKETLRYLPDAKCYYAAKINDLEAYYKAQEVTD